MVDQKLLSVKNLTFQIGDLIPLTGINFNLDPGEVLGVVGQRGSGKTTLFKILSGLFQPTNGDISLNGKKISIKSPSQARQFGIETVYQQPELIKKLDVLSNIFLGRENYFFKSFKIWPNFREMEKIAKNQLYYFDISPEILKEPIFNLTNEQKQIIALIRAFCKPAFIYLMDNPLSALSYDRQKVLINRLKDLAAQNMAIIVSSDDIKHIFSLTDRILVLYEGKQVALLRTSQTTPSQIVELIVGSDRKEQVTPVIWAFEKYHSAQQQAEELRKSQLDLQQNLEVQDSLNRLLVDKLREQVEALDHLNLAIQEANRRLMTEREAERKALARDLHDQVIQDLISYNYQLEGLENEIFQDNHKKELLKIRNGIRHVVSSLRLVCSDLRPPTLDSQGLDAAIHSLIHEWSEQTKIKVELQIDPDLGRLTESIELSVFRIIQEGLSNVRKHANASLVKLSLQRTPTASLVVNLADNGQGSLKPLNLSLFSKEKHYGLLGISERVALLGGDIKVNSPSTGGLELKIEIPSPYPSITQ